MSCAIVVVVVLMVVVLSVVVVVLVVDSVCDVCSGLVIGSKAVPCSARKWLSPGALSIRVGSAFFVV